VYEEMFEHFKLPDDDGFVKKPKYVAINYTAIYYQTVVLINCPYFLAYCVNIKMGCSM
jgi:hypothetical protein